LAKASTPTPAPDGALANWTLMVYMAAGQSPDLDMVAVRDLKEMERGIGSDPNVHVVVQINRNWPPSAQLYQVHHNGSKFIEQLDTVTNMGDGAVLTKFVREVAANPRFKARNYGLILWGHAYGLGFGRDHNDPLFLAEIKDAAAAFAAARQEQPWSKPGTGGILELLGTNACAMSYIEAAYEMREVAQFMVASQITMPFAGWPYEAILGEIESADTPFALARSIIDAYVNQFNDLPGGNKLTMTALNLTRAGGLNMLVHELAVAIKESIRTYGPATLSFFRDVFMGAAAGDVRPLIDVVRLCEALSQEDAEVSPRVRKAASKLAEALRYGSPGNPAFIAHHRRDPELDDLNGVGIYAPFVTDDGNLGLLGLSDPDRTEKKSEKEATGRTMYEALQLFKLDALDTPLQSSAPRHSAWPALVYRALQRTIPRDLQLAIDGISEMRNGDRADVAQIIMAIDSSLNQLDRAVARAGDSILELSQQSMPLGTAQIKPKNKASKVSQATKAGKASNGKAGPDDAEPKTFDRRHLVLLAPVPRDPHASTSKAPAAKSAPPDVVHEAVEQLIRVERALAEVERTIRRGFTNARFGLGPLSSAAPGFINEPPKSGSGVEPPKSGGGVEPPKSGGGVPGLPLLANGGGDLRVDLAMTRVCDLFQQVGQALAQLEDAASEVETMVRAQLAPTNPPVDGQSGTIERAFLLLQDASSAARRTMRRVLAHPVYGLGPAEAELTFDARQELARGGGLDKRHLRLL
jgi:hypothetical protein